MDSATVKGEIQQLERLRAEAHWWRVGSTIATIAVLLVCMVLVNNSVRGLTQPGPTQEAFTQEVGDRFQKNILPNLQNTAGRTLTEMRPQVETAFQKLNDRVPEVTQASLNELDTLQKNLPDRGGKAVANTFGKMLQDREPKIRQMFPEATEENVNGLVASLSDEAAKRSTHVGDALFARHITAMQNISTNMEKIRLSEKGLAAGDKADWEAGLLFLDIFRDQVKKASDGKSDTVVALSAPVSTTTSVPGPAKGGTK